MIPGFNHNIKHKGRIFHIQTEDSGEKNPHVITHVFVGGNILGSKKTEYGDLLGDPEQEKKVRTLMEEQHKQMLRNLVHGVYDTAAQSTHYQPGVLATEEQAKKAATEQKPKVPGPKPAAPKPPPEIIAARAPKVPPKVKEQELESLFGRDLISEKSLDEVILSYLAGDPDS